MNNIKTIEAVCIRDVDKDEEVYLSIKCYNPYDFKYKAREQGYTVLTKPHITEDLFT